MLKWTIFYNEAVDRNYANFFVISLLLLLFGKLNCLMFSSEKDTVKIVSCNAAGNCASVDTGRVIEHKHTIPDGYSAIPKTGKTLLYLILDFILG